ncbi:MAG: hypothetical protein IJC08_01210 [Bacteroidaceae bacterium]|nr:hypothetical protein [Bacteroidaceae bacterium]
MSAAYWMLRSEDCSTAKRILIGHISVENPCCKAVEQNSGDNSGKSIHQIVRLYIMLWRLTQEQLSMLEFPLGSLMKSEIKEKAQKMALPNADAPESQEICFVPSDDYVSYIEERKGKFPTGDFKDENGKTLGRHGGIIRYTVGQRKGLGVSLGKPAFVMAIDPALHTVTLTSDEGKIFTDSLTCNELNFMLLAPGEYETVLGEGKIRYAAKPETAEACIRNGTAEISFVRRVRAVTPGQSVVFYREGKILFGGMIE